MDWGNIIGALIGSFSTAILWILDRRKIRKREEETTTITVEYKHLRYIKDTVDEIFEKTKADRFLILMAENGKHDVKYATATYEQHGPGERTMLSLGASQRYVKVHLDDSYRIMLKAAELKGVVTLDAEEMKPCLLRDIYKMEGVRHSCLFHIKRYKNMNGKDRDVILYATLATHEDELFNSDEITRFKLFIDALRKVVFSDEQQKENGGQ